MVPKICSKPEADEQQRTAGQGELREGLASRCAWSPSLPKKVDLSSLMGRAAARAAARRPAPRPARRAPRAAPLFSICVGRIDAVGAAAGVHSYRCVLRARRCGAALPLLC